VSPGAAAAHRRRTMLRLPLTAKRNQRDFVLPMPALAVGSDEPAWEQIRAAVAGAADLGGPLYLTGGEPTLRRDLITVVRQLAEEFPQRELVLFTNARAFYYPELCDALESARGAPLHVEVPVASMRREVHDQVAGVAESLDQASRGVQNLLARGWRTSLRVLMGTHNAEHLHDVAACIPDRFPALAGVIWDAATLAGTEWWMRPDRLCSRLESALNLLAPRGVAGSVFGMPACLPGPAYRERVLAEPKGSFRPECEPCELRARCPGMSAALATDPEFALRPVRAGATVDYDAYLLALLARYVPQAARTAGAVLDAMCGQAMRNLPGLRRFFAAAAIVRGIDLALQPATLAPPGTTVDRHDLRQPLGAGARYELVALFKPPCDRSDGTIAQMLAHLVDALEPGGYLLIVLAEHTDVDHVLATVRAARAEVLVSEPNALRDAVEPEHKWVLVCRKNGGGR